MGHPIYQRCESGCGSGSTRIHFISQDPDPDLDPLMTPPSDPDPDPFRSPPRIRIRIWIHQNLVDPGGSG